MRRDTRKNPTFIKSWGIAARGFVTVFRSEWKVQFAFFIAALFIAAAVWLGVSYFQTLFILFLWGQVVVGEIFNTSLEKAMDYSAGREFHPLIQRGKDYAAASVFILSLLATFITLFILWQYI